MLKKQHIINSQKFCVENSFDFVVKSIGIFDNITLIKLACLKMNEFIQNFIINKCDDGTIKINQSNNNIPNCFDITIENHDYTIGKVIEFMLYENYFKKEKILSYCAFIKNHPHDIESYIKIAFNNQVDNSIIKDYKTNWHKIY